MSLPSKSNIKGFQSQFNNLMHRLRERPKHVGPDLKRRFPQVEGALSYAISMGENAEWNITELDHVLVHPEVRSLTEVMIYMLRKHEEEE